MGMSTSAVHERRRDTRRSRGLERLAASCLLLTFSGCHHDAAPPAPGAAPAEQATPAGAKAEYHEETFDLTMRPVGPLTAGAPGSVEIQLSAKAGYHCNDKYPYKFKVGESPGVKYATAVFAKDALTLEEKRATMKVDVTPEVKGETTVRGVFSFSLCSAERCLVEKRELETKIPVI